MKEILFRGKVVDNSIWVQGFFVNCRDYYDDEIRTPEIIATNCERHYAGEYDRWECYPVIEGTVGQWIGLMDRKGNLIFEGDIVKTVNGNIFVVKYDKSSASFVGYIGESVACHFDFVRDYVIELEVIGNIWDNPELVEEMKEYSKRMAYRKDCCYCGMCEEVSNSEWFARLNGRTLGEVPNCATCSAFTPTKESEVKE